MGFAVTIVLVSAHYLSLPALQTVVFVRENQCRTKKVRSERTNERQRSLSSRLFVRSVSVDRQMLESICQFNPIADRSRVACLCQRSHRFSFSVISRFVGTLLFDKNTSTNPTQRKEW